jgi:phospholipase C
LRSANPRKIARALPPVATYRSQKICDPPTRSLIGQQEAGVNHQYDFTNGPGNTFNTNNDFWNALADDHLPAVSFLKAGAYQDGHPGYSDPLDEQIFLVQTINRLMKSKEWNGQVDKLILDPSTGLVISDHDHDHDKK